MCYVLNNNKSEILECLGVSASIYNVLKKLLTSDIHFTLNHFIALPQTLLKRFIRSITVV